MALIKCFECGKSGVSSTAVACPGCGADFKNIYKKCGSKLNGYGGLADAMKNGYTKGIDGEKGYYISCINECGYTVFRKIGK